MLRQSRFATLRKLVHNEYPRPLSIFQSYAPLCNIANLIECMVMFYFTKGLSVFRIVTEPSADRFLLLGGLAVALHNALDVGGFGGRED